MKKGQLDISFGIIFSIILIIVFISVAFYAINKFLDIQSAAQVGKFNSDFQNQVNLIWSSDQATQTEEYFLPTSIKYVCFIDFSSPESGPNSDFYNNLKQVFSGNQNLFYYPIGSSQSNDAIQINNIDLSAIIKNENPYCIKNNNGKLDLVITKNFGAALVSIQRV